MEHRDATPSDLPVADVASALAAAGCVWPDEEAQVLARAAGSPAELAEMARRRCAGEPLEYVVGRTVFCGIDVLVERGVFVPRPRTEFLARCACALARGPLCREEPVRVLDLCCGTGAVALVLCRRVAGVRLWATDLSPLATACARGNLAGCDCTVLTGDLFEPLAEAGVEPFDLIVVNAPYVPTAEARMLPAEARDHEPAMAWDGGPEGFGIQRRVLEAARAWMRPQGFLLMETSRRQSAGLVEIAESHGFRAQERCLVARDATVVLACLPYLRSRRSRPSRERDYVEGGASTDRA